MPFYVDGVLIKKVFCNGQRMKEFYSDGVLVFTETFVFTIKKDTNKLNINDIVANSNDTEIEIIIEPGVTVYSDTPGIAAITGTFFTSKKITIVNKGKILGCGGRANGGAGGTAIYTRTPVILENYGEIYGGGGGGGQGGKGRDSGYNTYTQRTEDSGQQYNSDHTYWQDYTSYIRCWWYGDSKYDDGNPGMTSFNNGGWTYYRGRIKTAINHGENELYYIGRRRVVTDTHWNPVSGGAGGFGGRGQGYTYSNSNGKPGKPSKPAGKGNSGYNGGAGGKYGEVGKAGHNGGAGGRAGYAIDGSRYVTMKLGGNLKGACIN